MANSDQWQTPVERQGRNPAYKPTAFFIKIENGGQRQAGKDIRKRSLTPTLTPWSGDHELTSRMDNEPRPDMSQQPNGFEASSGGFGAPEPGEAPF